MYRKETNSNERLSTNRPPNAPASYLRSTFGHPLRDKILESKLESEVGNNIVVESDNSTIYIKLIAKDGSILSENSFGISSKNNNLIAVNLDSELKILDFTFSNGKHLYCSLTELYSSKQDLLVSGLNIKTINGQSVLGSGNLDLDISVDNYIKYALIENNKLVLVRNNDTRLTYNPTDENFTTVEKQKLATVEQNANYYVLPTEVVKDQNYVHTDANYTLSEKNKLATIEIGAEKNLPGTVIDDDYKHITISPSNGVSDGTNTYKYNLPSDVVKDALYIHTDNNYTTTDKNKLTTIENGAQKNLPNTVVDENYKHITVNSEEGISDGENVYKYILPDDVVKDEYYVHTDTNYTVGEKEKLETIENGAQVNVSSDWSSAEGTSQLLNKSAMASDSILYDQENNNLKLPDNWVSYLRKQTFKTPSIDKLTLCNSSGSALATTYELGSEAIISKIIHKETNIDNLIANTLKFNNISITPSEIDMTVDIDDITVTNTTTYSISASYIDTENITRNISKSSTLTFNRYAYSKVSSDTTTPTSGTKQSTISSFSSSGADFNYSVGDYIYLFTTAADKTIQTYVLGQWADVTTERLGQVSFTQANGSVYNYYAYRTGPFTASGTAKYKI